MSPLLLTSFYSLFIPAGSALDSSTTIMTNMTRIFPKINTIKIIVQLRIRRREKAAIRAEQREQQGDGPDLMRTDPFNAMIDKGSPGMYIGEQSERFSTDRG